jgi:thiamine-phosphate pyrophosphorylase
VEVTSLKKLHGLYLVVDPTIPHVKLISIVEKALKGGVDIVQLWVPSEGRAEAVEAARALLDLARSYKVPFIINNDVKLAKEVGADGVHLDGYDVTPAQVKAELGQRSIVGYTLGNDLSRLQWAEKAGAAYVSFCAMFPTTSVTECEIVPVESIKLAKSMSKLPVFASGGINLKNAHLILEAGADGIAVISAILKADDPEQVAKSFKEVIKKYLK